MNERITVLIEQLGLEPHPEGGFYKESYRSDNTIPMAAMQGVFSGDRAYGTSIYFLLTADNFSAFHRIKQDEIWHHYEGGTLEVHEIDPQGRYSCYKVGKHLLNGETPQRMVPAGSWFASCVAPGVDYALTGCTVSPGFDFDDFELANRNELIAQFPENKQIITELTR